MEKVDNRKSFRIECKIPICTQISIVKFNNKMVTTGKGNICVENISSGGLKFLYSLNLPVSDIMIIEFKVIIEDMTTAFYGNIVRKEEIDSGIYRYGVKFINKCDEDHQKFIRKLEELNEHGILNNSELCECNVIDCIRKYTGKFNKRICKRYKLNNNFVGKMKVDKISNEFASSQWTSILIDDISQDGIQFITDDEVPMDEDTILEFKIIISDRKIYAKGYALWRIKTEENKYRYGVKLSVTNSDKEKIAGILEEVVDFSLERGILVRECFRLNFSYSKSEDHNFEWWV
ncbi:PilZ domain-containing protein [Clostridium bowmanii]|uniref:PilZ domain-containing protein n=1 Tax=Clostridium bowmanii TaxID=132925 RepID=UPI001C0E8CF0|nr:PilZ domain-containing protein [Clostridium bowmanii]MBU3188407.1 PilZ domain-containing protein [Clostridium bowmanii]MCA1072795.1 PilZ domain-containing protein [Clostridium bowmanii]